MARPKAKQIATDTANFDGALTSSEDDVQKALEALDDAGPTIKTVDGSRDVDVSAGDDDFNITGVTNITRIRRAWFWISENGQPTVGVNTEQEVKLSFFAKDTFLHTVDDADPSTDGQVVELAGFNFVVQDVETAITASSKDVKIDETELYAAGLLIRIVKSTNHEFQRIDSITNATDMLIINNTKRAYALNDDVALVLEVPGFDYEDQDATGEIHMRISPGNTAGNDIRLHWHIEFEATKR